METKKLAVQDIMIGDYVKYKDGTIVQIARVGDVSPMDAPIYCHTQLEGYFPCHFEDIEPIPLTAEILERNGFKNIDTGLDCDGSNIYWKSNNGYSINTQDINLNFVHELQHALRLCGINDKEIVL